MTGRICILVAALVGASLLVGDAGVGLADPLILWQIRLPRTVLAAMAGGALALSGAALQGALRNRLADPGLLGIGGTAALAAVVAYYWGIGARFALATPLAGLLGGGLGAAILLGFAGRAPTGTALIVAGIGLSAIASALLALALTLAPNPFALAEITQWLMGSVENRTLADAALAAPLIVAGAAVLLSVGRGLDALALDEATAASLGLPVGRTLRRVAIGSAVAVGAVAACAGGIGFVGLIVPNLMRPLVGERPSALLAPSLAAGAALLLAADIAARIAPLWLPLNESPRLGILTALVGAPFLIVLSRRSQP